MGISKLSGKPDDILGGYQRWTSIPSKRSSNTPSRFMLQKPGCATRLVRLNITFLRHVMGNDGALTIFSLHFSSPVGEEYA